MSVPIVVVGAGGFGREVLDLIEAINESHWAHEPSRYHVLGVVSQPAPTDDKLAGYGVKYLGSVSNMRDLDDDVQYVVAIGDPGVRRRIVTEMGSRTAATLIHPSVSLGRSVVIGKGSVVCAGVRLTNHIVVGEHVHINLNCTVGHDAHVSDFVTLSPLVAVSGNVVINDAAFVGTGATINPGLNVGSDGVIGSGAVVVRDVGAATEVVGVPARPR